MPKILTNLDLNKNQILNAILQNLGTAPANPVKGQIYFDTSAGKDRAYVFNGTEWIGMDALGASMTGADIIAAINNALTGLIDGDKVDITLPTVQSLGLDKLTNNKQIKANETSQNGNIPTWSGTGGDALGAGYTVETTLTGATTAIARADAVKTYIDSLLAAADAMVYKGVLDASANPNYPAADAGHTYKISAAGKVGGASGVAVEVGDMIVCTTDGTAAGTQASVGANWNVLQANIDGAVIGPASAVNTNLAMFDGATGKLIKDSGKKVSDFAPASHTHAYTAKYSANVTASATQTITHNLNTEDVVVTIREAAGDKAVVYADVKITGANTISISFATAPTAGQYRVVVVG